jgi:hypothetical protein
MPNPVGTVRRSGQLLAGPVPITLISWLIDGERSWRGNFIARQPVLPGELDISLTDGRAGRAVVTRSHVASTGAVVVFFEGTGPLQPTRSL